MNDLIKLSKYFQPNHTVEQIQGYLNGLIEKQRVGITQNNSQLNIILYLMNKDQIKIPLDKKVFNNTINYKITNIIIKIFKKPQINIYKTNKIRQITIFIINLIFKIIILKIIMKTGIKK